MTYLHFNSILVTGCASLTGFGVSAGVGGRDILGYTGEFFELQYVWILEFEPGCLTRETIMSGLNLQFSPARLLVAACILTLVVLFGVTGWAVAPLVKPARLSSQTASQPVILVTPDSLDEDLISGETATHTLTITNQGGADLEFRITIEGPDATTVRMNAMNRPPATVPSLSAPPPGAEYVPGRVIVKLHRDLRTMDADILRQELKAKVERKFSLIGVEVWSLSGMTVAETIAMYQNDPRIVYLEPDYIVQALRVPDDPLFGQLWGMHNIGQTGGLPDADIDAPEAWSHATGGKVIIGVIDTGVDYVHEDLAGNIWINPGEIPDNGVDDDGNGYIDDVHGWDFINNDNDPMDDHYHGTHCSGTIAGVGNNGLGVAGVCWQAKIMALKFLDAEGKGLTTAAIAALEYAVANGADLTSNSWGSIFYSRALYEAIAAADTAGQLFVASAGNNGYDIDMYPVYPCGYDLDNIISVAATTPTDAKASFSNWGMTSVDLGAPGVGVISCLRDNSYGAKSGTSMAAPHVAGAAALIRSQTPILSHYEIKGVLLNTVDTTVAMEGVTVSGGRLNIYNAIKHVITWLQLDTLYATVPPGLSLEVTVIFDAAGMLTGDYYANIVVLSNDPEEPVVPIPAHLHVTGVAEITITPDTLDFGEVFIGYPESAVLNVANTGTEILSIDDISSANPDFAATSSTFALAPFTDRDVIIDFAPGAAGLSTTVLTIVSDDPDAPVICAEARGVGLVPPEISLNPDSLSEDLFYGDTSIQYLTISNSGGSDLLWRLQGIVERNSVLQSYTLPVPDPEAPPPGGEQAEPHALPARTIPVVAELADLTGTKVIFDATHGQTSIAGWTRIVDDLELRGATVIENTAPVTPTMLKNCDIFWIIEHSQPFLPAEIAAVQDWLISGGAVLLEGDQYGSSFNALLAGLNTGIEYADTGETTGATTTIYPHETTVGVYSLYHGAVSALSHADAPAVLLVDDIGGDHHLAAAVEIGRGRLVALCEEFTCDISMPWLDNQLFANRIYDWLNGAIRWLSVAPDSGVVTVGSAEEIAVLFYARAISSGDFNADIEIISNDPGKSTIATAAHLHVISAPDIVVGRDSLDFDSVFIGASFTSLLRIANEGTDPLIISGVAMDHGDFTVGGAVFSLAVGEILDLPVTFAPGTIGPISGTLTIASNDRGDSLLAVPLHGVGVEAPVIVLYPDSLHEGFLTDETPSQTLIVTNKGKSNLYWEVRLLSAEDSTAETSTLTVPTPPEWLAIEPMYGTTVAGSSTNLTVTFNGAHMEDGHYRAQIEILSNDPADSSVMCSVSMTLPIPVTICNATIVWPPYTPSGVTDITAARMIDGFGGWPSPDTLVGYTFTIGLVACRRAGIAAGDSAEVYVDVNDNGAFDQEEQYPAMVTSVDREDDAREIIIRVSLDNDPATEQKPAVAVYSIGGWVVLMEDGRTIESGNGGMFARTGDPLPGEKIMLEHTLDANYPNPFNAGTIIVYAMPEEGAVKLEIFNILGRRVKLLVDGFRQAGRHEVCWDGTDEYGTVVGSGIFFYRLVTDDYIETRKMVLIK